MIKIINTDGIGYNTRFLDAKSGQDVTQVVSIESIDVHIGADKLVEATARLAVCQGEIAPDKTLWETKNPATGRFEALKAIEFHDGTRVEFRDNGFPDVVRRPAASAA